MRLILTAMCVCLSLGARAELPQNYQQQSEDQKLRMLWNNLSSTPYENLPGLTSRLLLQALGSTALLSLKKTIDTSSDEMPEGRIKFIHTYGSCVAVEFVPASVKYTGIFQSGAIGIARLGWAAPPEFLGHIPGMAVKFLVSGKPSVNIQVMNSLNGQGDNANFFAKSFSNQLEEPKGAVLEALGNLFKLATKNPFYLPVGHLARQDRDGTIVGNAKAPEILQLEPRHSDWISRNSKEDLRNTLTQIRKGSVLYDMYGVDGADREWLGTLRTISPFVNSEYCDKKIFFQHNSVEANSDADARN